MADQPPQTSTYPNRKHNALLGLDPPGSYNIKLYFPPLKKAIPADQLVANTSMIFEQPPSRK